MSRPAEVNIEDLAKRVKSNDILQKRIDGDYDYLGEGRNSSALSVTSEDSRVKTSGTGRKVIPSPTTTRAKSLERLATKSVEKTQQPTMRSAKPPRRAPAVVKQQRKAPVVITPQRRTPVVTRKAPAVIKVQKSPSFEMTTTPAKSPVSPLPSDSVPTPGNRTPVSPSSGSKPKLSKETHQEMTKDSEEDECCCCFLCWCWCCCPR